MNPKTRSVWSGHCVAGVSLRESTVTKARSLCGPSHRWRGPKHRAALPRVPDDGREDERRSDAGFKRPLALVEAPRVFDGHFLRSFVQPGNAPARRPGSSILSAEFDSAVAPRSANSRRTEYEVTLEAMRWLRPSGFAFLVSLDTPKTRQSSAAG